MKLFLLPLLLLSFGMASKPPVKKPVEVKPVSGQLFTARSSLPWMKEVARISNCVIKNEQFLKEIESSTFTHTNKSSHEVAKSFREMRPVILSTYRTTNPGSATIATTYKKDRTTAYFNLWKNPRKMPKMINTSFHEGAGHLQGWSHGDNSPKGKEKSVPYQAGKIAEKYVEGCL